MKRIACAVACLAIPVVASCHPYVDARAGYFFFYDSTMKKAYSDGGIDAQVVGAYPMYKKLRAYLAVEYSHKSGRAPHTHNHISLQQVPINFGIQPYFPIGSLAEYYVSIGPRYIFAHANNGSAYPDKTKNANGFGWFINTGFLVFITNHWVFDIFGEFSSAKLHFHAPNETWLGHTSQLGGFTFGGGFGYAW
jgi:hypothetical protein